MNYYRKKLMLSLGKTEILFWAYPYVLDPKLNVTFELLGGFCSRGRPPLALPS